MNVVTYNDHVLLREDNGKHDTKCGWVTGCPTMYKTCKQCPADNDDEPMSFSDVVEWWKEQ